MTESAYWSSAVLGSGRPVQVMAAVDSEALFKAKCKQLKLPEEAVTKMAAKGWTTYGTFAFAVPGDPGKISNSDFRSIVCQPVLGSEQEHVPKLRRLHFEAFAITAAELKRTAEVQESDQPRKLPVVELAARYEILQQRVKPLKLVDKLEPSAGLGQSGSAHAGGAEDQIRRVVSMYFACAGGECCEGRLVIEAPPKFQGRGSPLARSRIRAEGVDRL